VGLEHCLIIAFTAITTYHLHVFTIAPFHIRDTTEMMMMPKGKE
jgi:hypothetical protein